MALADLDPRSPTEISRDAGLSPSYIRDLVRFPDRSPVMARLDKLAAELGTTGVWLAYQQGEPPAALTNAQNITIVDNRGPAARNVHSETFGAARLTLGDRAFRGGRANESDPRLALAPDLAEQSEVRRTVWGGQDLATLKKDLPVRGTAAGNAINSFTLTNDVIETVRRPPALEGVPDSYAIRAIGRSMVPLHKPRALCFVHPHLPYGPDDSVVIQIRTHESAPVLAYIKVFVRETEDGVVVKQLNPPQESSFSHSEIVTIHKIMTMDDIFAA
ncbi:MAG TPA: hypothetical protein VMU18_09340 [Rhodoblastus sp.]|nr:hypothetical protein [Rhodoblastus sp.]